MTTRIMASRLFGLAGGTTLLFLAIFPTGLIAQSPEALPSGSASPESLLAEDQTNDDFPEVELPEGAEPPDTPLLEPTSPEDLSPDDSPSESQPQPTPAVSPTAPATGDAAAEDSGRLRAGVLRVGNRTPYPLRVVVLNRRPSGGPNIPAHWDFAPSEGGSEGLTLSLQAREPLTVYPGDVIMAFSLDGSRRYWGPNVVDETLAPFWSPADQVWTMILQP